MLAISGGKLPHGKGIVDAITMAILGAYNTTSIFKELHYHMFDTPVEDNNIHNLVKCIVIEMLL
jgi:hypothetical protein